MFDGRPALSKFEIEAADADEFRQATAVVYEKAIRRRVQCELRLCLGIIKVELKFKMDHGSERLFNLLKKHSVYPFTDLDRETEPFHV